MGQYPPLLRGDTGRVTVALSHAAHSVPMERQRVPTVNARQGLFDLSLHGENYGRNHAPLAVAHVA